MIVVGRRSAVRILCICQGNFKQGHKGNKNKNKNKYKNKYKYKVKYKVKNKMIEGGLYDKIAEIFAK